MRASPAAAARPSLGRLALGAVGVAGIAVGGWLVLSTLPPADWLPLALWLGGPVAVHDALLVPLVLAVAWVGRRVLPRALWGPAALGLVVTGGLTAVAVVELLRADDTGGLPGLLDRDYATGYALALTLVWAAVALVAAVRLLRGRRAGPPRARHAARR